MPIFGKIEMDFLSPFKTICPSCKKEVKLEHLRFSEIDDTMRQKLESLEDWKKTPRFAKREQYEFFASKVKPHLDKRFIATIAKIEPHKLGLFKQQCELSNRFFTVYHHVLFDHKEQKAGATSTLGEEVDESTVFE